MKGVVWAGELVKGCRFLLACGGGCLALVQGLKAGSRGDTGGVEQWNTGQARQQMLDLEFDDSYGTLFVPSRRTWICIFFNIPLTIYMTLLRTRAGVYVNHGHSE